MVLFTLPLPVPISSGGGGGSSNALYSLQSSIQLDANNTNGTIIATTNNKNALYIDNNQRTKLGDLHNSIYKLSVNDEFGACIELIYNKSNSRASLSVASNGVLNISSSSNTINLPPKVNIAGHNGVSNGLILGGVLVTSTAHQLNYNNVLPGTVLPEKSIVVDAQKNISGINEFTAQKLYGILQTASQPNITSVKTLNIENHNGVNSGLALNGVVIQITANELNYLKSTPGIATPSKTIILDANRSISNLLNIQAATIDSTITKPTQPNITSIGTLNDLRVNGQVGINRTPQNEYALDISQKDGKCMRLSYESNPITRSVLFDVNNQGSLTISPSGPDIVIPANKKIVFVNNGEILNLSTISASTISGTLQTGIQPNITSIGTLTNLRVSGPVGIGTSNISSKKVEINDEYGMCLRLSYNSSEGNAEDYTDFSLDSSGNLYITPSGPSIHFKSGSTLQFGSNGTINGLSQITSTSIFGTITKPAQPNITSLGALSSLTVNGNVDGINELNASKIYGKIMTPTQPNITSLGNLSNLVVSGPVSGITTISANEIYGSLKTSAQPNITSLGILTSLTMNGPITGITTLSVNSIQGTIMTASQPNITSVGTLTSLNVDGNVTVWNAITASKIYGTIYSPSQPYITKVGILQSLEVSGNITCGNRIISSEFQGTIVTQNQPNIRSIGALTSLTVNGPINGVTTFTCSSISGTITTETQPNITSLGTLTSLRVNGTIGVSCLNPSKKVEINDIDGNCLRLSRNNSTTATASLFCDFSINASGNLNVSPSGTSIILNSNKSLILNGGNISGVDTISATSIDGTILTPTQTNISQVGRLVSLDVNNYIGVNCSGLPSRKVEIRDSNGECLRLTYKSTTITSFCDFIISSSGQLLIDTSGDAVAFGDATNITVPGGSISGLSTLSSYTLSGTLNTSNQPNITSVGILQNLRISGNVGINVSSPSYSLALSDVDGKCLCLKNASNSSYGIFTLNTDGDLQIEVSNDIKILNNADLIFNGNNSITGLNTISSTNIFGTLNTSSQPNISSLGILTGLTSSGIVSITNATNSTSISTGALKVNGGIGVMGSTYIGGNLNVSGTITGILSTAAQPNITSIGTLQNLNVSNGISINTTNTTSKLNINDPLGYCLRLMYDAPSLPPVNYCDIHINSSGGLRFSPTGNQVQLSTNTNLELSGTSKITAPQLIIGNTTKCIIPLEVGVVPFNMTAAYAFNNNFNGHGVVSAGSTTVYNYSIRTEGRILCTGSVDVTSDIRLKKNIKLIDSSFCESFVLNTDPVSFNWKNGETNKMFGYIAQDILKSGFGELVNVAEESGLEEYVDEDNFISPKNVKFTISYDNIIPILAKNQKNLLEENKKLRSELEELKKLIKSNLGINI